MTREQESARAHKIAALLGAQYAAHYDICESGFTVFSYKRHVYKRVHNEKFSEQDLNIYDFDISKEEQQRIDGGYTETEITIYG